jgi:L-ascorbate metabolism protein UlaG (beta-lactamase superfamily)
MENENRWYKSGAALLNEIDNAKTESYEVLMWFLGQLGFVIKINETVIYIDALLNDFTAEKGNYRLYKPPYYTDRGVMANYFICTHNHGDHLNLDTLLPQAKANPLTCFIVPVPSRTILTSVGIAQDRVIGAREGEAISLFQDVSLIPVAAAHTEYEQDSDGNYTCLGYVICGNGVRIYHAGDTIVTARLVETLRALKPIDIAILPINGGDWERTANGIIGNMHIEDAVKLVRAIDIDLTIPAHFDMMSANGVNPARFADEMYRVCPQHKYHVFALGEQFRYRK